MERQKPDFVKMVCMLVIIIFLYVMLQSAGILNILVPSQLADTKMGYGMLFMIGLLTSVHCIAMCGGINLSQCISGAEHNRTKNKGRLAAFFPAFAYNLGLGPIVAALGKKFTNQVMAVGAVLVVVLGLAMLSQGGSLSGWLPPDLLLVLLIAFSIAGVLLSTSNQEKAWKNALSLIIIIGSYVLWSNWSTPIENNTENNTETAVIDGVQIVNSTLYPGTYPSITVQTGVPVRWVIDAPEGSINGCNYKMLIPNYDMEYTFQIGENVIEFTPTKTGTVQYSCWMGMIRGSIFVTEDGKQSETAVSGGSCCGF